MVQTIPGKVQALCCEISRQLNLLYYYRYCTLQCGANLQKQLEHLHTEKSELVKELPKVGEDLKDDIKAEIAAVKANILDTERKLNEASDLEQDLIDFVKFALEYTNILKDDWWKLNHEDRLRCQQLILPGGISFSSQKKVGTPEISPLYRLRPNKKDLSFSEKSLLEELAGTAPASAGLSWLVVYRYSLFCGLKS